jgi:predicted RNase H-like HicB family nuclease
MKEYVVVYEWTGQNYSAYVPDLPGCVACADTLEETEALMQGAISLYVEALKTEQRPVPEPVTKVRVVSVAA